MIGFEDEPEKSAEIAVFELLGVQRGTTSSGVRYGVHPWGDPAITDEFFEDSLPMVSAHFHLYAVEWTPLHVHFFIDNVRIRTVNQSPSYPMQFLFSIFELPFAGDYDPAAPYPKVFTIDYFRAYQPLGGY